MEDYVKNHPTPGRPSPATENGTPNNATPEPYLTLGVQNPVISYLTSDNAGNQVVVNVTQPGHNLFPGYVARTVSSTRANNFGEGLGDLQSKNTPRFIRDQINNEWYNLIENAKNACECQ